MIDTVKLIIKKRTLSIDPLRSNGKILLNGSAEYRPTHEDSTSSGYLVTNKKQIVRYSKNEKKSGKYLIKIDFQAPRGKSERINLEFSIPKLMYGSNLFELDINNETYEELLKKLSDRVSEYAQNISLDDLKGATVTRLDIYKNIIIDSSSHLGLFISKIARYRLNSRYGLTLRNYQNGKYDGNSCTFYNNSQALKFYDKLEEIRNKKNPTIAEQSISKLLSKTRTRNVVRIERSLQKHQSVNSVLKKHTGLTSVTLKDIWSKELLINLLTELLDELTEQNLNLFTSRTFPANAILLGELVSKMSLDDAKTIFFLKSLVDEYGSNDSLNLLKGKYSQSTVNGLLRRLKLVKKFVQETKVSTLGELWEEIYKQIRSDHLISVTNWKELLDHD